MALFIGQPQPRPLRIYGVSGSASDRRHGFELAVKSHDPIDLIVGDWMSEANMPSAAMRKLQSSANNGEKHKGFEASFLRSIDPALKAIAEKKIKVVVNAGASDTELLCNQLNAIAKAKDLTLNLAWISGDEVIHLFQQELDAELGGLINMATGEKCDLPGKPVYAQAYLGGRGIFQALSGGADIVLCGRVADASPVIGGAMWWHGWDETRYDELARALIAGHLIECSTYVTGGNFSGFKTVPGIEDLGFPVIEIGQDGEIIVTKLPHTGGEVTRQTVSAQLLYEIQGPYYFNSDVVAVIDKISIRQLEKDRVLVEHVFGLPPPPTTKVGLTYMGGYQSELHWSLVGLDIEAKAKLLERNIRDNLGQDFMSRVPLVKFSTHGVAAADPESQDDATVDFRVMAQSPNIKDLSTSKWVEPVYDVIMCSYPGATPHPAITTAIPRPFYEYQTFFLSQSYLKHQVHMNGEVYDIPVPKQTRTYAAAQPSYDHEGASDLASFGPTTRAPLGYIVHARSGDKGANANVGFWVRTEGEYDWLRSFLTISKVKELLAKEYKEDNNIDRFELPGLRAVHFLLHDHLDRGVNSTSTFDLLGKNVAEFLRARYVNLPTKFLHAGKI